MTERKLRNVTLEEYIEANGGLLRFLEGLIDFAKEHGMDWRRHTQLMYDEAERKAAMFRRIGLLAIALLGGVGCAPITAGGQLRTIVPVGDAYEIMVPEASEARRICVQWSVETDGNREWEYRCIPLDDLREQLFPD